MSKKRIIVGMSGGVDSSVAALILKNEGHRVEGMFMKNWEEDDTEEYCSATQDLEDTKKVCEHLDIPLRTVNFSFEYWDNVFKDFIKSYKLGYTPNPDVICNEKIKFHTFLNFALSEKAEYMATGHYAKIRKLKNTFHLFKSKDKTKDQTYFLHSLAQDQLKNVIFPLASLQKNKVRKIAKDFSLPVHDKKDSTGVCFIGERKFKDFLKKYIDCTPGKIIDASNNHLGNHDGLPFYTIGQRSGLGIGGVKDSNDEAWYVADKNKKTNELVVVQGKNHKSLYHTKIKTKKIHWIDDKNKNQNTKLGAKIRYLQDDQECIILKADNESSVVEFANPQRAVAPGQYIVFYSKQECLGGAIISEPLST